MASTKVFKPKFSVYQLGLGRDPVIVVGRILSLVAPSMFVIFLLMVGEGQAIVCVVN
jgi:hypothetical protein